MNARRHHNPSVLHGRSLVMALAGVALVLIGLVVNLYGGRWRRWLRGIRVP